MDEISLYFHIPFCTVKCSYCHFYVIPDKDTHKKQLMEGFYLEWQQTLPKIQGKKLRSIYFGGGTPSLMGPDAIAKILSWVYASFNQAEEVTLEANPENITFDLMLGYRKAGITRVSIGIQTLDNQILKTLGRLHSGMKAIEAVHYTFEAGITNISVDLMYDLPHQTLLTWQHTVTRVLELPISHLSLYNLTIEPYTLFFKNQTQLAKVIPDEQVSLTMYRHAVSEIGKRLPQYEISAFAKPGLHSIHNTGYWLARPFWGFGPSAFSYFENRRFRNVANLSKYHKSLVQGSSPIDFEECLDSVSRVRELLAINLRLIKGVNLTEFQIKHGEIDSETTNVLERLIQEGLLINHKNLKLSERGILFYDTIASEIV